MNENSLIETISILAMIAIFAWAIVRLGLGVRLAEKNAVLNKENSQLRDKIFRAQNAYFVDGSDGDAAMNMLLILMEENPNADH